MRIEEVVVNASPLIALFRSGQAGLLPRLFSRIVVPDAGWQEVAQDEWDDAAARELGTQRWPIRENVAASQRIAAWNLGALCLAAVRAGAGQLRRRSLQKAQKASAAIARPRRSSSGVG